MRKIITLLLCLTLAVTLIGCGSNGEGTQTPSPTSAATASQPAEPTDLPTQAPTPAEQEKTTINIATLAGPTGMGMAKLMADSEAGETSGAYNFTIAGAPDEIVGKITSGEIDVAAAPTNLAAVLYNKTEGKVQMAALNTLGVIYIVEKGDTINSVEDLKGKTIVAAGQGSTPEYVINYILNAYGIADDVTIEYKTEHSEAATLMAADKADVVLLPEPHVTSAIAKTEGARIALDLTKEWKDASAKNSDGESVVAMGCIIVRKEFVENNKEAFDAFMQEYEASAKYVVENVDGAAKLIVQYGIIPSEEVAKKALPNCNIVFIDGQEMKDSIVNFLTVLHDANPASVGGKMPEDNFYYMK